MTRERTCNQCGWVAYAVTRESAEAAVSQFNAWFDKQPPETKEMYGGHGSTISGYEHCIYCGNEYTNFREAKPGECPVGCTLNPIIDAKPPQ